MHELIPDALDGERLDRVVAMLADVSRSAAATAIADGQILVDGAVQTTRSTRVSSGQSITIADDLGAGDERISPDGTVDVHYLHVDDHVLVIDKAPGQVVHPGAGNSTGTIAQGVLARFPEVAEVGEAARPGVVHRLDKGTSGVFMMARSDRAYRSLTEQLRARTVDRRYRTIVWGHPDAANGVIDAPIGRAVRDPTRMTIRDDGRPARTRYSVEQTWDEPSVALVSCVLETGRTHQIRVHLAAIGHPVVGDHRYGGARAGIEFDRPALHAAELSFSHPVTGERLEFASPLPPDLAGLLDRLGDRESG